MDSNLLTLKHAHLRVGGINDQQSKLATYLHKYTIKIIKKAIKCVRIEKLFRSSVNNNM